MKIVAQINKGTTRKEFSLKDGLLFFNNRFVLNPASPLQHTIMAELHNTKIGGHLGFFRNLERIRMRLFWNGIRKDIHDFVSRCTTCQQVKLPTAKSMGLLQPLDIPSTI